VLFIPVAYKNYGIAVLTINFVQYIVPAVIFYIPYLLFMVLVGASMSNIEQLYSSNGWRDMSQAEKWRLGFTLALCFVTVALMIVFIVYTVIVYRRIRREIKEMKNAERVKSAADEAVAGEAPITGSVQTGSLVISKA
jgi:cbb3-type cytochrome oxidase subunit 3